ERAVPLDQAREGGLVPERDEAVEQLPVGQRLGRLPGRRAAEVPQEGTGQGRLHGASFSVRGALSIVPQTAENCSGNSLAFLPPFPRQAPAPRRRVAVRAAAAYLSLRPARNAFPPAGERHERIPRRKRLDGRR